MFPFYIWPNVTSPSAFPSFPRPLGLNSHQAALGQQYQPSARTEKSRTHHPFLCFEMITRVSLKSPTPAPGSRLTRLLAFSHHAVPSYTLPGQCTLSPLWRAFMTWFTWPTPGWFGRLDLSITFLGKPFLKSPRVIRTSPFHSPNAVHACILVVLPRAEAELVPLRGSEPKGGEGRHGYSWLWPKTAFCRPKDFFTIMGIILNIPIKLAQFSTLFNIK